MRSNSSEEVSDSITPHKYRESEYPKFGVVSSKVSWEKEGIKYIVHGLMRSSRGKCIHLNLD